MKITGCTKFEYYGKIYTCPDDGKQIASNLQGDEIVLEEIGYDYIITARGEYLPATWQAF